MNLVFLGEDTDLSPEEQVRTFSKKGGNLVFVSELRMGFGIHPNSGIAQELSEAVDHIFRQRMDAIEDPINRADPRPAMQQWLAEREELERRVGGHQRRLYSTLTYCDDNIIGVVGIEQGVRAIRLRREIEREAGLIMAIPKKRMLGTWGLWLGILIFSSLGCVIVPRAKLVRASDALRRIINTQSTFDEYRSVMGLLEHIRHALFMPRRVMHGLYAPHGPDGEGRLGPCTTIRPNLFMAKQLLHWLSMLSSRAGAFFTGALKRATVHASSGHSPSLPHRMRPPTLCRQAWVVSCMGTTGTWPFDRDGALAPHLQSWSWLPLASAPSSSAPCCRRQLGLALERTLQLQPPPSRGRRNRVRCSCSHITNSSNLPVSGCGGAS